MSFRRLEEHKDIHGDLHLDINTTLTSLVNHTISHITSGVHELEHDIEHEEHHSLGTNVLICIVLFVFAGTFFRFLIIRYEISCPYTVWLLVASFVWGIFFGTGDEGPLSTGTEIISGIDPHLFLMVFIPPLIFESAFSVNYHTFDRVKGQALILAGPGILIASLLSGLVSMILCGFTFAEALLFGAMVSATDPVAVVALLRDVGASKKLATLIEAESLLNDGTAFVLYTIVMSFVVADGNNFSGIILQFVRLSIGGLAWGAFAGYIIGIFLFFVHGDFIIETSLTFCGAFITFWLAMQFQVSDILAVVAFGLYLSKNRVLISPSAEHSLHHTWEFLAYVANTLIFFMTGVIVAKTQTDTSYIGIQLLYNLILYIALHIIRFGVIFLSYPVISKMGYGFSLKDTAILGFGGLRGAIGLALALLTRQSFLDQPQHMRDKGDLMLFHTSLIVVWTLLLNASIMPFIVGWLQIDKLTEESQVIFQQVCTRLKHEETLLLKSMKDDPLYSSTEWKVMNEAMPDYDKLKRNFFKEKAKSFSYGSPKKKKNKNKVSFAANISPAGPVSRKSVFIVQQQRRISNLPMTSFAEDDDNRYSRDLAEYINLCDDGSLVDEIRHRVLATVKASYWHQFHEGMISEESTKLLVESAEIAMDRKSLRAQWEFIEPYTRVPWWLTKLYEQKISYMQPMVNWILVNKLQIGIQLCESFVLSFTKVANMFEAFPEFAKLNMAQRIIAEGAQTETIAKKCCLEIKIKFSDIYRSVKTFQASTFVLNQQIKTIKQLHNSGVMEDKEFTRLTNFIQKQFAVAQWNLAQVRITNKGNLAQSVFKEASFLDHLDEDLRTELYKECEQVSFTQGETIFKNGTARGDFFIIASGMVELRSSGEVLEHRERGQVLGIISLISCNKSHCDAVAYTDVVVVQIPEAICVQMMDDEATHAALCKLTADILLERYFQDVFKQLTTVEINMRVHEGELIIIEQPMQKLELSQHDAILLKGTAVQGRVKENGEIDFIVAPSILLPLITGYSVTKGSIVVILNNMDEKSGVYNAYEVLDNQGDNEHELQHSLRKSQYTDDSSLGMDDISIHGEFTDKEERMVSRKSRHNNDERSESFSDDVTDSFDDIVLQRQVTIQAVRGITANQFGTRIRKCRRASGSVNGHAFQQKNNFSTRNSTIRKGSVIQSNKLQGMYKCTQATIMEEGDEDDEESSCDDKTFYQNQYCDANQLLSIEAVTQLKLKTMSKAKAAKKDDKKKIKNSMSVLKKSIAHFGSPKSQI